MFIYNSDNSFTQNSSSHSITCDFYNEQEEILPASDSHLGMYKYIILC